MPAANRKAPIGGATSWFVSRNAPCIRALAMPRSSRAHEARQQRAAGRVGERLRRAEDEQRDEDQGDVDASRSRSWRRGAPGRRRGRGSPATTMRRRSKRSAAAPPRTPKSSTGRYSLSSAIETRNGSRVWEATSSGPAAIAIAVADVVDDGRGQEPAEAPPEPRRRDGLGDPAGQGSHRRQDTSRCRRLDRLPALPASASPCSGSSARQSCRAGKSPADEFRSPAGSKE